MQILAFLFCLFVFISGNSETPKDLFSLCYELNNPECLQEDIEELWQDALSSENHEFLSLAKYHFEEGDKKAAKELVGYLVESKSLYPNFDGNVFITDEMQKRIRPHLMPLDHPLKPVLDNIFSIRVTQNVKTFINAGFHILFDQETSFVKVASHPKAPGYLFKVYLDDEIRQKSNKPGWHWLCNRCEGAEKIRKYIKKNHIKHFAVPDKWLYPLNYPNPNSISPQPVILVVQDMNITNRSGTLHAWQTKVTKRHLDELYGILKKGMGSQHLTINVPYSHSTGKFAFIDTEYPKRKFSMKRVPNYLSPDMQKYWLKLMRRNHNEHYDDFFEIEELFL